MSSNETPNEDVTMNGTIKLDAKASLAMTLADAAAILRAVGDHEGAKIAMEEARKVAAEAGK